MPSVLAIDVGGTRFRVALFDGSGRQVAVSSGNTLRSGGREWMLAELARRSRQLQAEAGRGAAACGVSFGGPVDFKRQRVTSVHTPGWRDFPLADWIQSSLGLPCLVDNDANAGALGEFRVGAGRGASSLIYITHSTGIGGGIICGGKVHRGRDSMAGEIGHLPLFPSEKTCTCGLKTGCTEALASGRALDGLARDLAGSHPEQARRMLELCGNDAARATARELAMAAKEGDPGPLAVFTQAMDSLALALTMAIRLLNPDVILFGGGVAQAGDFLIQTLSSAMKQWWTGQFPYTTALALSGLGEDSPLYGAAALAMEILRPDSSGAEPPGGI